MSCIINFPDSVDGIDVNGGGDTSSQTSGISSQVSVQTRFATNNSQA